MLVDLFEKYKEEVCSNCKAKCEKGICILQGSNRLEVQCINYKRDETKIKELEKPLKVTAKRTKPVMEKLS